VPDHPESPNPDNAGSAESDAGSTGQRRARSAGQGHAGSVPAPRDAESAQPEPEVATDWTPPTWDEVVREHSGRVFRLAYRLTGNRHDAEDLTQDVFIRVFRSLSSYKPGTFEGWLHRITTNLFLDQVRRKQRIRFDSLADDAADRLSGREPAPDRAITDNMLDADVQNALDQLAPDFRAAVVLCDIEGLSYEEIATTLDIKLGTVRSRIHRGRAQLRAALEHRAPARPSAGASGPAVDDIGGSAAARSSAGASGPAVDDIGGSAAARPSADSSGTAAGDIRGSAAAPSADAAADRREGSA